MGRPPLRRGPTGRGVVDGWMAMPDGLTPAIRLCCSPGLHLFSCFVSSVSKHFRWIAQLFKKSLQSSITLILLFLQKRPFPSLWLGSGLSSKRVSSVWDPNPFLFHPSELQESSCSCWLPYHVRRAAPDLSGRVQYVRRLHQAAAHRSMKGAEHQRPLLLCIQRGAG